MYFYYFISNQWQIRDLNYLLASLNLINVHIVIVILADINIDDIENKSLKIYAIPRFKNSARLIIQVLYFFLHCLLLCRRDPRCLIFTDQPTRIFERIIRTFVTNTTVVIPHVFYYGNTAKYQRIEIAYKNSLLWYVLKRCIKMCHLIVMPRVTFNSNEVYLKMWEEPHFEKLDTICVQNYHFQHYEELQENINTNSKKMIFASSGALRYNCSKQQNAMHQSLCAAATVAQHLGCRLSLVLKTGEDVKSFPEFSGINNVDILEGSSVLNEILSPEGVSLCFVPEHSSLMLELLFASVPIIAYRSYFEPTLEMSMLHRSRFLGVDGFDDVKNLIIQRDKLTVSQRMWVNKVIGQVGPEISNLIVFVKKFYGENCGR